MGEDIITQELVRDIFNYDPISGSLRWKVCRGGSIIGSEIKGMSYNGYSIVSINKKQYRSHRIIWLMVNGKFPRDEIDHINGDRLDNRIVNLRDVTHQENSKNKKMRSDNSSGIVGVSWHKQSSRWRVQIDNNGDKLTLGCFNNLFDACCVRRSAEIKYNYHPNHGRK